ncbi:DUF4262 domain-containing protein [Ruegeria atlantica]|uniref:DUF4262 domain-containing protein n=1 Tax=Ruegeria atlantica TaxID=81569 RepID=UPI00147E661B|nr:DUF4262 domain-containing protein [Ruegeria atlantica]
MVARYPNNMTNYTDYEQKLFAIVKEHGWQLTYVFDPEGIAPDFGYSVGFSESIAAPEFIIFGLPRDFVSSMLWEVYRQIIAGAVPVDGMRWHGLLEGFDCISRKAVREDLFAEYVVSAQWFWQETGRSGNPEVFQIVWPGAQQGLFPWEQGCDQSVIAAQPPLWLAK